MYLFSYQQSRSAQSVPITKEMFDAAIDSPNVETICRRIYEQQLGQNSPDEYLRQQAKDKITELKSILPAFCWHATFKENKRNAANAIPSGLVMLDVDHIDNPEQTFAQIKEKALTLNLVAAHITPSGKGLRLVFVTSQGMSIPDAQSYLSNQLGVESDPCVKDLSRISYLVPRSYWLYINYDALFSDTFTQPPVETEHAPSNNAPQRISRSDRPDTPNTSASSAGSAALRDTTTPEASNPPQRDPYPTDFKGIPYATIVEELNDQFGGTPVHGMRNSHIYNMACQLRYICNNDPEWVAKLLPTYGEAESKWYASIKSACQHNLYVETPKKLRMAIELAQSRSELHSDDAPFTGNIITAEQPPEPPKKLPRLIDHLVQNIPEHNRAALSTAIFPSMSVHLHGVTIPLIDGTFREPILMSVIIGPQSSGKSGIKRPVQSIMADIVERDKINREREKEWKELYTSKGNNKDKPKRPDDLIIQKVASDFTNAALVDVLDKNGEYGLFSILDEIEMLNQCREIGLLLRTSFDAAEYGQERVSAQSVSAIVNMRWNIIASTTKERGLAFFKKCLLDGTISRLSFSILFKQDIDNFAYGKYTAEYDAVLKPYIANLNNASGEIHCPKALDFARKLQKKALEICALADDDVMEEFVYRAVTIAYTKAMILYIAQDRTWDKTIENYMEWSLFYDLWAKNHLFGTLLAEATAIANKVTHRGKPNLLDYLPDKFTAEMVAELRRKHNMNPDPRHMLSVWLHREFIVFNDEIQMYEKTAKYKLKA